MEEEEGAEVGLGRKYGRTRPCSGDARKETASLEEEEIDSSTTEEELDHRESA